MTEDFKNSDVFSREENVNQFILVFNDTALDKITNDELNKNFKQVSEDINMMVDELQNILGINLAGELNIDTNEMKVTVAKQQSRQLGIILKQQMLAKLGPDIAQSIQGLDKEQFIHQYEKDLAEAKATYMDEPDKKQTKEDQINII